MKKRLVNFLLLTCLVIALLPATAFAASNTLIDGWYNLRCMNNYLNLTADGKAELRTLDQNEAFYVQHTDDWKVTLKTKDGRYLGVEGERKNGANVVALSTPYVWSLHWEKKSEIFSLRPPEAVSKVLNASGQKKADGTPIIIWSHEGSRGGAYGAFDAPQHAEFRFIPINKEDPSGESFRTYKENGLVGYLDFQGNVAIPAKFSYGSEFSEGVASVCLPGKKGMAIIDTSGKALTPYKYYQDGGRKSMSEGLLAVAGYSDAVTKQILEGDSVATHNPYTKILTMKSGKSFTGADAAIKYGFVNGKGQEVIKPQFEKVNSFKDGMAAVFKFQRTIDGADYYKVGWINTAGKLVIPYSSDAYTWFSDSLYNFSEGMTCKLTAMNGDVKIWPSGAIINKSGKVIVSVKKNEWVASSSFGLRWKDGVIATASYYKVDDTGKPSATGKYGWPYVALYDYSGRLLVENKNYTDALPLGGGYTLALHQVMVNGEGTDGYWSVFNRNGKIVVEKAEVGNYHLSNAPYGYENGFVYFGDSRYQVDGMAGIEPKHPFFDVKVGSYYEEAVIWALKKGVTGGTSATTFSPEANCTRAQVATFLWKASGSPEPKSTSNPFTDVKSGDYFYKPVLWAVEKGITGGTSATTFSPHANCTGGQVVTFLWKANGSPVPPGMDIPGLDSAPYYTKAVAWASEKGLLDDMGGFSPEAPSPRANIITYLYRNDK